MSPTAGAVGVSGWAMITTFDDAAETQPRAFVTVKVYVAGASPVMDVLVPEPVVV
jgi:hypothetical protein